MAIIGFIICVGMGLAFIIGGLAAFTFVRAWSTVSVKFSEVLHLTIVLAVGCGLLYFAYLNAPFEIIVK